MKNRKITAQIITRISSLLKDNFFSFCLTHLKISTKNQKIIAKMMKIKGNCIIEIPKTISMENPRSRIMAIAILTKTPIERTQRTTSRFVRSLFLIFDAQYIIIEAETKKAADL